MLLKIKEFEKLPPLYSQENVDDPTVHLKLFTPLSNFTWYITEGSAEGEDFILYAFTIAAFAEWGYVSLNELKALGPLVERDRGFEPGPWSEVKARHIRVHGDLP